MALWYFLRLSPGELRPLDTDDMERFLRGELPLPADEERWVRWVGLEVLEEQGTALGLERLWFGRARVRENGTLDAAGMLSAIQDRLDVHERLELPLRTGEPVVEAQDVFLAKRLHHERTWRPEEADVRALRAEVERRAGWALL